MEAVLAERTLRIGRRMSHVFRCEVATYPTPLLITDRNTIAIANRAARRIIGPHVVGQDTRVALRQPEAISLLNNIRQSEAIVRGLVRRGDIW